MASSRQRRTRSSGGWPPPGTRSCSCTTGARTRSLHPPLAIPVSAQAVVVDPLQGAVGGAQEVVGTVGAAASPRSRGEPPAAGDQERAAIRDQLPGAGHAAPGSPPAVPAPGAPAAPSPTPWTGAAAPPARRRAASGTALPAGAPVPTRRAPPRRCRTRHGCSPAPRSRPLGRAAGWCGTAPPDLSAAGWRGPPRSALPRRRSGPGCAGAAPAAPPGGGARGWETRDAPAPVATSHLPTGAAVPTRPRRAPPAAGGRAAGRATPRCGAAAARHRSRDRPAVCVAGAGSPVACPARAAPEWRGRTAAAPPPGARSGAATRHEEARGSHRS